MNIQTLLDFITYVINTYGRDVFWIVVLFVADPSTHATGQAFRSARGAVAAFPPSKRCVSWVERTPGRVLGVSYAHKPSSKGQSAWG